jgi:hypothetical protein
LKLAALAATLVDHMPEAIAVSRAGFLPSRQLSVRQDRDKSVILSQPPRAVTIVTPAARTPKHGVVLYLYAAPKKGLRIATGRSAAASASSVGGNCELEIEGFRKHAKIGRTS